MKKLFLSLIVAIATLSTTSAQNLIADGTFETTTVGNFTPNEGVPFNFTRNVWGASWPGTGNAPAIGIASEITGTTGNCATFSKDVSVTNTFLFQRLSATSGINSTKTYKLTAKLKCSSGKANGYFYLKNRTSNKYAVRANWTNGDLFPGVYTFLCSTTWTEFSQTFVFSKYADASISTATVTDKAFTASELADMILGFYSVQSPRSDMNNTVYIDDIQLEEVK